MKNGDEAGILDESSSLLIEYPSIMRLRAPCLLENAENKYKMH